MSGETDINPKNRFPVLLIYIALTVAVFAVFWQVNRFDFINFDDQAYVSQNSHIQSGFSVEGLRWAFTTEFFGLWNPLVWLSLMLDYKLIGLNPGGYHVTNLVLHLLSALLLFWLFNRMTKDAAKSAFVAALFALHPLHVESVAWIAERKDVLSAFFWMLTLCLYVRYTENPVIKRYLFVVFSFALALLSKPMVVTLPLAMILLDYWPLKRFESQNGNLILWQLKEKAPFFILSAALVIVTLLIPKNPQAIYFSLSSRLANASVSFMTYIIETFSPGELTIFYPFTEHLAAGQIILSAFAIIIFSAVVIAMAKRLPWLFTGWFWFVITILPVIGIIQISLSTPYAMADRYHYLPSIGLGVLLAWGIPLLFKNERARKAILWPAAIAFLAVMAVLSWQQCRHWKNSDALWRQALRATENNYLAHANLAQVLVDEGKITEAVYHYSESIRTTPAYANAKKHFMYNNRGVAFYKLGATRLALDDYNTAIKLKPDYADAYYNRGTVFNESGQYQAAVENYNKVISLDKNYPEAYNNRGTVSLRQGKYLAAIEDFNKAISLKADYADAYNNRGGTFFKLGRYDLAAADFDKAVSLKPDYADAVKNRNITYHKLGIQ